MTDHEKISALRKDIDDAKQLLAEAARTYLHISTRVMQEEVGDALNSIADRNTRVAKEIYVMADPMDDKATIATLTRQLEAAKGALEEVKTAIDRLDAACCSLVNKSLPDSIHVAALRDLLPKIVKQALATLSPTPAEKPEAQKFVRQFTPSTGLFEWVPAEKPEAVETGEHVAWREALEFYACGCESFCGLFETGYGTDTCGWQAKQALAAPPAPTPPAPDDEWLIWDDGGRFTTTDKSLALQCAERGLKVERLRSDKPAVAATPEAVVTGEPVARTMSGETVFGFPVAAYRETHPEHGDRFGHRYSEHWSTPSSRDPRVKVERLFTETQLRAALAAPTPPAPDDARARALHEAARVVDEWPEDYPGIGKHTPEYYAMLDRDIAIVKAISALALPQTAGDAR